MNVSAEQDKTLELESIDAARPQTIRRRTLELLCVESRSKAAIFFKCVDVGGTLKMGGIEAWHRDGVPDHWESWSGAPVEAGEGIWNLRMPDWTHLNRFANRSGPVTPADRLDAQRDGLAPHAHHLQGLFYDDNRFLGTISLFRPHHREAYTDDEVSGLAGKASRIRLLLARAERLEAQQLRDNSLYILMNRHGETEQMSDDAAMWLAPARRRQLAGLVEQMEAASETEARKVLEHTQVHCIRLGGEGRNLYLVAVQPPEQPRMTPSSMLTERQREVAEYAAVGATVHEIAETLDISANTVKHHLKNVYDRLGIGSRAELARLLEVYAPAV